MGTLKVTTLEAEAVEAAGDINAAGGFRRTIERNIFSGSPISTTFLFSYGDSSDECREVIAARAGSVVEIVLWCNNGGASTGSMSLWVQRDQGTGTWIDFIGTAAAPAMALTGGATTAILDQAKGVSEFAAGERMRIWGIGSAWETVDAENTTRVSFTYEC